MVRERWDASWEQVCKERWEAEQEDGQIHSSNTQGDAAADVLLHVSVAATKILLI